MQMLMPTPSPPSLHLIPTLKNEYSVHFTSIEWGGMSMNYSGACRFVLEAGKSGTANATEGKP